MHDKMALKMTALRMLAIMSVALITLGCESGKSETGYSPRKVGMGDNDIRAAYAPAFSPESRMTDQNKKPDFGRNVPGN